MIYISCFLGMQQPFFFHIKPTCALKSVRFMRLNCIYRSTYIYLLYFEVNACFFFFRLLELWRPCQIVSASSPKENRMPTFQLKTSHLAAEPVEMGRWMGQKKYLTEMMSRNDIPLVAFYSNLPDTCITFYFIE